MPKQQHVSWCLERLCTARALCNHWSELAFYFALIDNNGNAPASTGPPSGSETDWLCSFTTVTNLLPRKTAPQFCWTQALHGYGTGLLSRTDRCLLLVDRGEAINRYYPSTLSRATGQHPRHRTTLPSFCE